MHQIQHLQYLLTTNNIIKNKTKMTLTNITKNRYIVLALMFFAMNTLHVKAQDEVTINYEDDFHFEKSYIIPSDKDKPNRVPSQGGGIITITYLDNNMPDSLKTAVDVAANVWRDYLNFGDSLSIAIKYEPFEGTDVNYDINNRINLNDNTLYPSALFRKRNESLESSNYDAIFNINSNTNWCLGIGMSMAKAPKKLSLAMLQLIARSLGYGSSIKKNSRGEITFDNKTRKTIFDNVLFSADGKYLKDIEISNKTELEKFSQQEYGKVYAFSKNAEYEMYTPAFFENRLSLRYSANPASIMYYGDLEERGLMIDNITLNMLSELGWNFRKDNPIKIVSDDIDETGIASAYQSHKFHVETKGIKLSTYHWKYKLPLKNGGYKIVTQSNSSELTIPNISNDNLYEITPEGDIRGTIEFIGTSEGKKYTATYIISLELKPKILDVQVIKIEPTKEDHSFYDASIGLSYVGSHYVIADVEQGESSLLLTYSSYTPYYANFIFSALDSWTDVTLYFTVNNKYGENVKTLVIPSDTLKKTTSKVKSLAAYPLTNTKIIQVFDLNGCLLETIHNIEEIKTFKKGMYILRCYENNGMYKMVKYNVK